VPRIDPHSYFDMEQPRVQRVFLRWRIDFDSKQLIGDARLRPFRPIRLSPLNCFWLQSQPTGRDGWIRARVSHEGGDAPHDACWRPG
jgi:hypothetical protein